MPKALKRSVGVLVLTLATAFSRTAAQQTEPEASPTHASGTLNIVLANRRGVVIAADSRMSSDVAFECHGRQQLHCDNSQKLFRTTSHSSMAIAGFAVGRWNTPFDLTLAAALRRMFGANGLTIDDKADQIPGIVDGILTDPLIGAAAIQPPTTPPQNLSVVATFVRIDPNHVPVLQQLTFTESWAPMGPLHNLVPRYSSVETQPLPISRFVPLSVGIRFVADGILAGVYKSDDPVIQSYYRRMKKHQLDDMPLDEMSALARVILRETGKVTDYVGGGDQIAVFPVEGPPTFQLPDELPTEMQTIPRIMRWEGLRCTNTQSPPCGNPPISFSLNYAQPAGVVRFTKFLLGSEFKDVAVALDNNLFVADSFEGATLKWTGGPFFSYRNTFTDCVLELTAEAQVNLHPELAACRAVRKAVIDFPPETVGLPMRNMPLPPGSFALPRDIRP